MGWKAHISLQWQCLDLFTQGHGLDASIHIPHSTVRHCQHAMMFESLCTWPWVGCQYTFLTAQLGIARHAMLFESLYTWLWVGFQYTFIIFEHMCFQACPCTKHHRLDATSIYTYTYKNMFLYIYLYTCLSLCLCVCLSVTVLCIYI